MKKECEKSRVKNYSHAEICIPLSSNTELQEIEKCKLIDNDHFSITEQIPIITEPKIKLGKIKCEKLKSNEVESIKPAANSSAYEVVDLSSDDGSIDFEAGTLNHTLYDLKFNKTIPDGNNCSSQSSISINHSKYQMDSKYSKDIENHLVIRKGSSVKKISKVINKRSLFSSDNNYYKDVKLSDGICSNAEANTSKCNIEQKNALQDKSFIFTQSKIGNFSHENSHLKSKQQASRKYQNSQKMPKETTVLNNLNDSLKSKLKEFNVLDVAVLLPSNVSKNGKLLWSLKKQRPSLTNVGNLSGTETHSLNKEERYNFTPEYLNKFSEGNYSPTTNLLNKVTRSFDEKPKITNIDTAKSNQSNLYTSPVSLENINSDDFEIPLNEHIDLQKYGNIVYNHVLCDPLSSVSLKNLSQNEMGEFGKVNCKLPLVNKPFSCSPSTKEPVQEIINNVHMVSNNLLSASQPTSEMINQLHFSKSILTNTLKQFSPITVYSHLPITKSCTHPSLRCTNSEANINKCENKNLFENTDKTCTHENFTLQKDSLYHQKNSFKRSPNFSSVNYEDSHLHSYELAPLPKSKTFRPKLLPNSSSNSSISFLINNSGTELNRYHLNQEKYKFSKMNKEYVEKIELSDSDITTITVSSYSSDDDEKSNTVIHSSDDYTANSVIHISSDSEEDVKRLCPEKESMHGLFLLNNLKKNNESEMTSVSLYDHGIFQEGLSDEEDEFTFDLSRRRRRKTASNKRLESFVHTPVLPTLIKVLNEDKTTPEKHPRRSISIRQMKKLSKSLNLKSFHIVLEKLSPVVIERLIDLCKNKSNWGEKEWLTKAGLTAYDIDRMRLTAIRQQSINTYSLRRFMKKNTVFQSSMNSPSKATKRTEIRHLQLIKTSKKSLKEEALAKFQKDFKEKNIASIRRALLKINCRYKNQSRFWLHLDRLCSSQKST